MFRLRVLGGFALEGTNGVAPSPLPQRRAEAVLAILAVCGDLGCTRDRLVALLWPESDEAHSRHNLRDTLSAIRHSLGADAVLSAVDHLRLNPSVVASDVLSFVQAVGSGRHAEAVRAYGGSLLDGFHVDHAPEFERWLDGERTRLGRHYGEALEHLATAAERARAWAEAAGWWAQAVEHDPLNSHLVLQQVQALAAIGDRANAIMLADAHVRRMREELDLEPDGDLLAGIERIRRGEPRWSSASKDRRKAASALPGHPEPQPPMPTATGSALDTPGADTPAALAGRLPLAQPLRMQRWLAFATPIVVAGVLVLLVAYVWAHGRGRSASAARRSVLALPLAPPIVDAPGLTFALSPDGATFVYVSQSSTGQALYVRGMEIMEGRPIPGTEGASTPFFSPDGRWVGFLAGGKLRKVPLRGGPVETICDAPGNVLGASWGANGIVFAPSANSGLMRVPAAGGTPVVLTRPDTAGGETSQRWPEVLPGGTGVLFTSWRGAFASARLAVLDLRSGAIRRLGAGIGARYSGTGHLVFATADDRLLASAFDLQTLQPSEATSEVLRGVRLDGGPAFAVGPGGTIIYMPIETAERTVEWVDRAGGHTVVIGAQRVYSDPRLSPDGSRLALTIRQEGAADVWVYSFAAGTLTRLTRGAESIYPVWSPDGRSIVFASSRRGDLDLYEVPADGREPPTLLWAGPGDDVPDSWSPDGTTLFFRTTAPATARDIWALRLRGHEGHAEPVLVREADDRSAMISPDGRWLAFTSDVSGADQVYVRAYPGPSADRQVSADGGTEPLWSRDGRELFYRAGSAIVAVAVDAKSGFRVVSRTVLFSDRLMANPFRTSYDVSRDGRRFLVVRSGEATAQLVALVNWLPLAAQ